MNRIYQHLQTCIRSPLCSNSRTSYSPGLLALHSTLLDKNSKHFSTLKRKPFEKILIANRGEIAVRVIRTAKRLGIKTVALYSNADANSLHSSMADEKYPIGDGPSPSDSYLCGDEVLDIALRTGSNAIHPGYGFLSENPSFAAAVTESNITFIGPPASAIEYMGCKSSSKSLMDEAGVRVTPGYHGDNQDPEFLLYQAVTKVGFPLLIKATMGGGGRGMRVVWNEPDFLSSLESCKRESKSAFGDSHVILEKYLVHPRHIEIQVMADIYGNTVSLHERDCSLQRRHQKIIEEAPASDLPMELREKMGQMAVKAAEAVKYVNAGTVEFLFDSQSDEGDFYFCEMNTRLQVEHPITELITGQDLVEWQLRIAAGEALPITDQKRIPCTGHAMEARIYAENPEKDFLPATGTIHMHSPPTNSSEASSTVRVDTGIHMVDEISMHYDPMVSKLIVHSESREKCLQAMKMYLKQYICLGVPNNIPFLIECVEHPVFQRAGAINTGFLDEYAEDMKLLAAKRRDIISTLEKAICAFTVALIIEDRTEDRTFSEFAQIASHRPGNISPWTNYSGSWRIGGMKGRYTRILSPKVVYEEISKKHKHELENFRCTCNKDGSFTLAVPDKNGPSVITMKGALDRPTGRLDVLIDGSKKCSFKVVSNENFHDGSISINIWSEDSCSTNYMFGMSFKNPVPRSTQNYISMDSEESCVLKAPFVGKITRIDVNVGDKVEKNETILTMEAMKMEHSIKSPVAGTIANLNCSVGDIVKDGNLLVNVGDHVSANECC